MAPDLDGADPAAARDSLTVSLLNRAVAGLLARGFPLVRVRGELTGLMRAASGHWYFSLKDDSAQVRCVMFRSRSALVQRPPRDGDAVEVLAQVTLYEARGEYQLNVESLRAAGLGRLYEEFLRLRERLGAEGLFDVKSKRALPSLPHAIGVVTSTRAAALRDVLATLQRRAPYCRIVIYPAPVQGDGAAAAIAGTLARASLRAEVDVLLLVRGGGSIEDLWPFNAESVARAIRASRIPIVVGVGHESDFTIADFAADQRAPTPTAAAEIAAPDGAALADGVGDRRRRLRTALRQRIEAWQQRLDFGGRALLAPRAPLSGLRARIGQLSLRAARGPNERAARGRLALAGLLEGLRRHGPDIAAGRRNLADRVARIADRCEARWSLGRARLERLEAELAHLDPRAVLGRGYSIVRDTQGKPVVSAAQLSLGDAVRLVLKRGGASARVEHIEREEPGNDPGPDRRGSP